MVEGPMEWDDPSSVGGCDRRLSRAARRLLESSLRSWLGNDRSSSEDDVWTLLEQWLRQAQPSECPLFPSRDCLRYEEEQSIPIQAFVDQWPNAIPLTTVKERRQLASSHQGKKYHHQNHHYHTANRWWKCGICHKVFLSRYYMDLHWNTHHLHSDGDCGGTSTTTTSISSNGIGSGESSQSQQQRLVCPAKDWCRMMGMANCYQQALMDEPYYDRGSSSGWDDHGKMMQHKFSKLAQSIPCHEDEIQRDCQDMLEACRVSDPTMIQQWCATWTCPTIRSSGSSSSSTASSFLVLVPDEWRRIWMSETYGYSYSGLIVGLLILVAIYIWLYYVVMMGPSGTNSAPTKKGLLVGNNNKNNRYNNSKNNNQRKYSSSDSRPRTVYDPVPASWMHSSSSPNPRPPPQRSPPRPPPPPTWRKEE